MVLYRFGGKPMIWHWYAIILVPLVTFLACLIVAHSGKTPEVSELEDWPGNKRGESNE